MSRNALVIGGLVLAAAAVALYFLVLDGGEGSSGASAPATPIGTPPPEVTASPGTAPTLPGGGTAPTLPTETEHRTEYAVGDIQVRDHRTGNHAPLDIPPNVHPAEVREIPSTLTHDIAQKVKAVMLECTQQVPREARGEKPRLEGQILIAIKDHKVTITKATMQLRRIEGASVDPTKQCIEGKSVGIETGAPDQDDLESYSINLTFAIP